MEKLLNKVPEVTLIFWIIKIMATTVGETGADFLIYNFGWGLMFTAFIMSTILVFVLLAQFESKRYKPSIYWLSVVIVSIVGTLMTDYLTDEYNVPLAISTAIFGILLAIVFSFWHIEEGTLSIHTINTRKRELFYWLAILTTFALGTAAGDLLAESVNLGYLLSGAIFGSLIIVVALAYYLLKINSVLAFWLSYILTRPFGASFGDYLSQSTKNGGLGFGVTNTSIVFLAIIVGLVGFLIQQESRKIPF